MGAIADKRLGDFLPTIDAYRPVAIAVAAILGLVVVLPGAVRDGGSPIADFSSTPASDAGDLAGGPTGDVADPVGDDAPAAPSPSPAPAAVPIRSSPAVTGSPRTPTAAADGGAPSARPSAPAPVPFDDGAGDAPGGSTPLRVVAAGWASTTGGTPVAGSPAERVPEGSLPVGARIGQTDKVAFVRLAGDATALVLAEDADGRRGSEFESSPVQLCQVTDAGWEPGGDQAMSDAPAYDPDVCAPGQQAGDGTWSFMLALFEDPTDARGLVIVPSADAPLDFQIAFAGQALG